MVDVELPPPVQIYAHGLIYASVCTAVSDEDTEAVVNRLHPTGIESPWRISSDPTFADGQPNPAPCSHGRPRHRHVLMSC